MALWIVQAQTKTAKPSVMFKSAFTHREQAAVVLETGLREAQHLSWYMEKLIFDELALAQHLIQGLKAPNNEAYA